MARLPAALLAATIAAATAAAPSAQAALVLFSSVGGAPTGVEHNNLDGLTLGGGSPQLIAPGVTLTLSGDARVVQGSSSGLYAAPFLSGSNGAGFGAPNQAAGADMTPYITSGSYGAVQGAAAEIAFGAAQMYFGLLWGSVDGYNTLAFYNGATLVGQLTGADVTPGATGDQGVNGTYYVNVNSDTAFNRVVMTSSSYAFEFDNIAWNRAPVSEPATLALLGAGLAGLAFARRRRRKQG